MRKDCNYRFCDKTRYMQLVIITATTDSATRPGTYSSLSLLQLQILRQDQVHAARYHYCNYRFCDKTRYIQLVIITATTDSATIPGTCSSLSLLQLQILRQDQVHTARASISLKLSLLQLQILRQDQVHTARGSSSIKLSLLQLQILRQD